MTFFLTSNLAALPSVASRFLHTYGEETVPFLFAITFKDLLPTSCTSCSVSCTSGISSCISCTYTDDYCYPTVFLFSCRFSNLLTSLWTPTLSTHSFAFLRSFILCLSLVLHAPSSSCLMTISNKTWPRRYLHAASDFDSEPSVAILSSTVKPVL